jgi:hypothetical protein
MIELDSGTGKQGENIEAHRISIFLYGRRPEFLDGMVMKIDPANQFEIRTIEDEVVWRGQLSAA